MEQNHFNRLLASANQKIMQINQGAGAVYLGNTAVNRLSQFSSPQPIGVGIAEAFGETNPLTTPTERATGYLTTAISATATVGGTVAGAAVGAEVGAGFGGWGAAIGAGIGMAIAAITNAMIRAKADKQISKEKLVQRDVLNIIKGYRELGLAPNWERIQRTAEELERIHGLRISQRIRNNVLLDIEPEEETSYSSEDQEIISSNGKQI